jgi:signal peptidase I
MKAAKKLLIPLLSLALFLGLFNTVFFWGYIPSSSMEPTIHKGDVILGLRLFRELHNGDIIIFERDGRYLVKRIAASSGDSVAIDGASFQVPEKSF